jgi:ankyrin repeat protein
MVSSTARTIEVPEERIIEAVRQDDIVQLRRWARQGLRVTGALPLLQAVWSGKLGIAQCLVQNLDADVNQVDEVGYTPLNFAVMKANLAMMRCLVKKLRADVNKAGQKGIPPLYFAAHEGK